ncbi:MAG: hypothetical protein ACAI35_18515 [Candidatus Methylacidiphilales bacterium]
MSPPLDTIRQARQTELEPEVRQVDGQEDIPALRTGTTSAALTRREWSDYLHPCTMLAARRAVRNYGFVMSFFGLQILMTAATVMSLMAPLLPADMGGLETWRGLILSAQGPGFWSFAMPAFLLILPFSGLTALNHEIKSGMTELMLMTRLTPFRIVYGAWIALAIQAVLMACTMLPFGLLRYYITGSNPVEDVLTLAALVVAGSTFSAFTVALSTVQYPLGRIAGAFMMLIHCLVLVMMATNNAIFRSAPMWGVPLPPPVDFGLLLVLLGGCITGTLAALGHGAMGLGSASYNVSHIARLSALAMTPFLLVAVWLNIETHTLLRVSCLVGALMFVPMLLDDMRHPQGHRPLVLTARTWWQRLQLPGWQAGAWWVLATSALWIVPLWLSATSPYNVNPLNSWTRILTVVPSMMGGLFLPFVIMRVYNLAWRENWTMSRVTPGNGSLTLAAIYFATFFLCQLISNYDYETRYYFYLNPLMTFITWGLFRRDQTQMLGININHTWHGLWPVVVLLALAWWEYRTASRAAQKELHPGLSRKKKKKT